jgi:lipoprotein-releasing system permease protein
LNFELFIAKRIISRKAGKKRKGNALIGTSVIAIALGLAVMIISVATLTGFKQEITQKLVGFSSHIQIVNFDQNSSFETEAIKKEQDFLPVLRKIPGIQTFHPFITKPGIIKSGMEIQGIYLKGIDSTYNQGFLEGYLIEGQFPDVANKDPGNQIVIGKTLATLLKLRTGDKITAYFIQEPFRMRPFIISGLYETGLEEYDKLYAYCDLRQIQSINGWENDEISGYEIFLENYRDLNSIADELRDITYQNIVEGKTALKVETIEEISSGFFDFLKLTDTNVWVILGLMVLVAGFNMISGLLIIILERTRMIGTLKSMGAKNKSLRMVFLYQAAYIIGKGLLWGNVIGISICLLQDKFRLIPLDPSSYFIDAVPININLFHLLLLNVGTLVVTIIMLLVPSGIISRISPDKTIKFE